MDSKMLGGWWVKLRIFLGMFTPNHLGEDFHPFWQLHMFQMGWFTARLSCWATWPRPVATGAFCWVSCGGFGAKSHDMICRKLKDGENDVLFEEISNRMWEKSHDNNEFFAPNDGKGPAIFIPSRPSRAASSLLGPKPLKAYDEAEADRSWPEDIRGSYI